MSDPGSTDVHVDAIMGSKPKASKAPDSPPGAPCRGCGMWIGAGFAKCPKCGVTKLAKAAATVTCADCHKVRGLGYAKCPSCGSPNTVDPDGDGDDDSSSSEVAKGMGFGGQFGKFPTPLPSASSTKFSPDPRLHSHPFEPDPARPASCKTCGMGTGTHGKMIVKPKDPPPEPLDSPVAKGIFGRIMDRAAGLLVPTPPDTALHPEDPTPILKAASSKRYSMAPVYMPGQLDAHGDFIATADDLQMATWGYVEETAADRTIYLQHSPEPAGKWVEIMAWPYEVTTTLTVPSLTDATGRVTKATSRVVTLPAGTVYMGVIWEPWANDEVQKGTLRGFSLGGTARRVEAVLA